MTARTDAVGGAQDSPMLRFSAIVCTRNRAEWSRRAVASLLAQDLPAERLEIVVVDNASTDDTATVLGELVAASANATYVLEPEVGLSRARNRGIAESTGDVIAFLDDDAEAVPAWAHHHLRPYEDDPAVAGTGGRIELGWPQGRPGWLPARWDGMYAGLDLGDHVVDFVPPQIPYGANMAFRRSALGNEVRFAVNLGRQGGDLTSGEERELFDRLVKSGGRLVYVPDAPVTHHVLPNRVGRRWFLRRAWAQGHTHVLVATVLCPHRKPFSWLGRAGFSALRAVRQLLWAGVRWVARRPEADRMDSLARATQNGAIAVASLRMVAAGRSR